MIAHADASKHRGTSIYADVITDDRTPSLGIIAERDQLEAVEVTADALGIEIRGVVMLEMTAFADFGTPDVERALREAST